MKKFAINFLFICHAFIVFCQTPTFTNVGAKFDLSKTEYAGLSEEFPVSTYEGTPSAMNFNSDGTKMFVAGTADNAVIEFLLSIPYDVSTASYANEFSISPDGNVPFDFKFNDDGTKMFVVGISDKVVEYTLSTGFDISSASHAGSGEEFSIQPWEDNVRGLAFGDNGAKMFVVGREGDAVVQYILSVAYDVSTASYMGVEFSVAGETTFSSGLDFSEDGTKFYTFHTLDGDLLEYTMSSAYDISSAVFSNQFGIKTEESSPNGFTFNPIGTKLFILGSTDDAIVEYNLNSVISYDENSMTDVIDIGANDGISSTEDLNITYTLSGDDVSVFGIDGSGVVTFNASPDFENPSDANTNNVYEITVIASTNSIDANQKIEITVDDVSDVPLFSSVGTGFDVSNGVYTNNSFLVEDEDRNPQGLTFSGDGKKMFMVGQNNKVFQYNLLTPYNLSNVTLVYDFGTASSNGITFNTSGSKMFLIGFSDIVAEYDLSVDFDLSTAVFSQEFDIDSQERTPGGVAFNSDGTKMFVVGSDGAAIVEYALGTAFDVSTASYSGLQEEFSVRTEESDLSDIAFSADGTKFFIVGGLDDAVVEYGLDVAFDVSTALYAGASEELNAQSLEGNLRSMAFNLNGTKLFIIGSIGDAVFEYELASNVFYDENGSTVVLDVDANDGVGGLDDSSISYSLSGNDASLFGVDGSGHITFNSSPDFENPTDVNNDNVYEIEIIATNSFTSSGQRILINVENVDDTPPTFTSLASTTFVENGTEVAYSAAADEEVAFTLGVTKDEGLFDLANNNEISFLSAPDFEIPADGNSDNGYLIDVIATDGAGNVTKLEVTITVTDADEIAPAITSQTTVSIDENTAITVYTATANEIVNFTLGSSKDESLFALSTDAISFTASPDYESPQDGNSDNDYLIDVIATDGAGNATSLEVTITVTDVDEIAPTFTSGSTVSIEENTSGTIYTGTADESVTFTLGLNKDETLFNLSTDAISFATSPDFEIPQDGDGNNEYLIDIIATDEAGNMTTLTVTITVTDVDEIAPIFTSETSVNTEENIVGTIYTIVTDEFATFSLGSSKDEVHFTLSSDAISFITPADFENPQDSNADNEYSIDLIATDGANNMTTLEVTITVTDLDEIAPNFTSENSVSIAENSVGIIYTVVADELVTFSLGTSKDEGLFALATDAVSFITSPDFENPQDSNTDNEYLIDLIATDAGGNVATLAVTITVTNVDEIAPTFTSVSSISIGEGTAGTIYTVTANESVIFSLGSGKDEGLFTLATDALSFSSLPDFENPLDNNADNVYLIDMIATDDAGNATTLIVTIIVTDQDEIAPEFTSGTSVSVLENNTGTIYIATADESVTFSLGSSKDEGLFTLSSDLLSFTIAPDFDNPQDSDVDNLYLLDITATDATGNFMTIELAITVTKAPLSIAEIAEIEIYPNPASERFSVNGLELSDYSRLVVIDSQGKVVLIIKDLSARVFDISSLGDGLYSILLESEGKREFAGKLVKREK